MSVTALNSVPAERFVLDRVCCFGLSGYKELRLEGVELDLSYLASLEHSCQLL